MDGPESRGNPQDAATDNNDMPDLDMPPAPHDCGAGCLGCRPARSRRGKKSFMELSVTADDDAPVTVGVCTEHTIVRSRFSIRNICCDSEVRLIERIISPLLGVQTVSVNSFQKLCIVEHCSPCCTTPETILNKLNSAGLGAALLGQGGDEVNPEQLRCHEWCRRHGRSFVVLGAAMCMLASACTAGTELSNSFQVLAVLIGLPCILWESVIAVKQFQIDVTLLVSIAVFAAAWHGEVFDASLVVFLFNLAKIIEAAAIRRVATALRVVMQLQTVRSVQGADGKQKQISDLQIGDVISLRPGEQCPADGMVSAGLASCSEAAMTGEATPVEKSKGGNISAGTLVLNGCIEVELTKPSSESRMSEIESRVQEAQAKRTERQMLISRFAQTWTPVVLVAALLTSSMMPAFVGGDLAEWRHRAVVLLLIACPCAIVIGAPLATTCAIAAAASNGVLIKRPEIVERLPAVTTVGLDKTGTLTKGEMTVLHVQGMSGSMWDETQALKLAAALEMKSAHPIAAAIVSRALGCVGMANGADFAVAKKVRSLPGVGIQGHLTVGTGSAAKVHKVLLGNRRALDLANADADSQKEFASFQEIHRNDTTVALIIDGKLQFGLALNDTLRPEARRLIDELKDDLGLRPYMLTGDSEFAAMHISACAGLDEGHCLFSLTPEEKMEWIESENKAGRKTLMLGDGVNDATALTVATVGVAIGETGAALSAQSAAVVLLTDKLHKLSQCIIMCRYAVHIERLSIVVPCLVKLLQGVAALRGELDLWMAVVADLGTLLLVLVLGVSILSRRFWVDEDIAGNLTNAAKRQGYEEFV